MVNPGVYSWSHAGGSFPVCLRPSGVFYCAQYASAAKWDLQSGPNESKKVSIDWKNYGHYELNVVGDGLLEGSQKGKLNNWRRMTFIRAFNEHEVLMMGTGSGSVWNFEWEKGNFEVEFRCDGYNHFICNSYPAHSHWSMEDGKVFINWDKYGRPFSSLLAVVFALTSQIQLPTSGDYELVLDACSKQMVGSKKGEPTNWRKLQFIRSLTADSLGQIPTHDHEEHVHGEHCSHHDH